MKKKRIKTDIWLMRFTSRQQCEVLRQLNTINDLNISLSTVCPNNLKLQNQILDNKKTLILNNNSICYLEQKYFKDIGPDSKYDSEIYSLYNLPSFHNYIALQILERFERFKGEISFEERNFLIKMQHLFWVKLLEERRPKYVVFADIPHMYYEFVLMNLLKKLGIKSFIIGNFLRDKHYFMDSNFNVISSLGKYTFSEASKERMQIALNSSQTKYDKVLNKSPFEDLFKYIKLLIKKIAGLFIFFLVRKKYYKGYFIKQGYYKFGPNSKFDELKYDIKYLIKCLLFPLIYKLYSSEVSFEKEYIYLPLLSGYENGLHPNLSPLTFIDIVKSALKVLKPNQFLYIKEHPAQFVYRVHQRYARNASFYRDILSLDKRIRFIKIDENTTKIIKNSIGVCAINFTSTFVEAKAFKKKIYCLGSNLINGKKSFPFSELSELDKEKRFIHEGSPWVTNPIQSLNIIDKKKAKNLTRSIMRQIDLMNNEDK